ncbi:flagellar hook-basal body complex protein [Roseovarius autotrophicus]|uniref:flagellar hook-basal body complex protein n=1 Tax=Roseovarius autotrophicus TaxID=2824121 RepID=UPI001A09450A|nr:flagellar hook-basal body complex protein [Roseovarius autotrophicus]MBE0454787.1 flagellar hook-basal body complex protein [Roseovarius sp.]
MEAAGYVTLTRQTGLMREMQMIANNIANAATTGYRAEGMIFSEFVARAEGAPSLSMGRGNTPMTSQAQGPLEATGGAFDFAIEGEGFFLIDTPEGERLTRAGVFALSGAGDLVTMDGFRVLDAGGAPVFIPPDAGRPGLAADGTLSANGRPLAQFGLYRPVEGAALTRVGGNLFKSRDGIEPVEEGRILQGFREGSNVEPLSQVARMIEVQRAYEMGQSFLEAEHERVRRVLDTFTR